MADASSAYRRDIDGMRAIAVLGVVAYHAGGTALSGGFVGVDVFFVISGYLITQLLLRELAQGAFSMRRFYVRRIRRILPALVVMMMVTTVAAACVLAPPEFAAFGQSVAAAAVGGSNMLFWSKGDYFDPGLETYPLLHTWSLGVEEQFYVVLPLALAAMAGLWWRKGPLRLPSVRATASLIGVAWLISFVGGVAEVEHSAKTAFFWLPPRAWELATGAWLAALGTAALPPWTRRPIVRTAMGWAGLVLVLGSMLVLKGTDPFPGMNAFWSCAGTAMLILAGTPVEDPSAEQQPIPTRLLSLRPFVGVGLVSFSLYLWHWPILRLAAQVQPGPMDAGVRVLLLGVIAAVSYLSWRYVEKPFRRASFGSSRQVLLGGVTTIALSVAVGLGISASHGLPSRMPADALKLAAGATDFNPRRMQCHATRGQAFDWSRLCRYGEADSMARLLVWGDSHAVEIAGALGEFAARNGASIVQASHSECPAALDFVAAGDASCGRFNEQVLAGVLASAVPRVLIVTSMFGNAYFDPVYGDAFSRGLRQTVSRLSSHGKEVYLLSPIPYAKAPVPSTLSLRRWWRIAPPAGPTSEEYLHGTARMQVLLDSLATMPLVKVIAVTDQLCPSGRCQLESDGRALYFDAHHLSMHGARTLLTRSEPLQQLVTRR